MQYKFNKIEDWLDFLETLDEYDEKKQRGFRLQFLRFLTQYSRKDFVERINTPFNTYKRWEIARETGLPQAQAQRLTAIFQEHHIICTLDWLMTGKGKTPVIDKDYVPATKDELLEKVKTQPSFASEKSRMKAERDFFCQMNPNAIYLFVEDDSMEPFYGENDIVAGQICYSRSRMSIVGKVCIIELTNSERVLRYVNKNTKTNHYDLICLNQKLTNPINYYNAEIKSAAPIVWHRNKANRKIKIKI